METSTGGHQKSNHNDSNNNDSSISNNNNRSSPSSSSTSSSGCGSSSVSSSLLKIRQFHSSSSISASSTPSPIEDHSLINAPDHGHQLTELTSSEISLDLQGLIDDSQFGDEENIFGDLMDGKKTAVDLIHANNNNNNNNNTGAYGHQMLHHPQALHHQGNHHQRTSPANSLGGSSGISSPGVGDQDQYPYSAANHRHTLAYVPGSVHQASYAPNNQQILNSQQQQHPSNNNNSTHDVRVKQEPGEDVLARQQAAAAAYNSQQNNNNNSVPYSNGTVSSTTPSPPNHLYGTSPLKVLSNPPPPGPAKYMIPGGVGNGLNNNSLSGLKRKTAIGERCSDEYRRRRERNNVAVRKSREKAKIRTRETEERVKILARENERLQKKVELLQEELSVLRSLFSNVGVLPDHIHRELSKHMDSFQAQHNAMASM